MEVTTSRTLAFVTLVTPRNVDQLLVGEPTGVTGVRRLRARKGSKAEK
jgi:hypothetical protein